LARRAQGLFVDLWSARAFFLSIESWQTSHAISCAFVCLFEVLLRETLVQRTKIFARRVGHGGGPNRFGDPAGGYFLSRIRVLAARFAGL
jgi:hypothetical protein